MSYHSSVNSHTIGAFNKQQQNSRNGKVGLCSKALLFPNADVSLKLIEWIELHKEQGYDKVKVLNLYYKNPLLDLQS